MKRCPHEGPHYRSVPKGEIGPWLCKDCLAQTEHEPQRDVTEIAERIDAALRGEEK